MRQLGLLGLMCAMAWTLNAGCEKDDSQGDASTDSNTETGTEPSSTDPACDESGGLLGDPCDLEELCDCDHLCGYQLWSEEKDGGTAVGYQCVARCEVDGPSCEGEEEVCVPRGEQPAVCLPTGSISIANFGLKLFQQGVKTTAQDLVTGSQATGSLGGQTLPKDFGAWGVASKDGKTVALAFVLAKASAQEIWLLELILPAGKWTPGTYKVGGFSATLLRSELGDNGAIQKTFHEAFVAAGTLTLTKTPQACAQSTGCESASGSLALQLLGLQVELAPKG
ncbi:MAG: hypothetical protein MUC50_09140 [Myxococcota bacterium]|jgi:hypothetical protein|nr:hypothetical protein [Myxococcota bacterium]